MQRMEIVLPRRIWINFYLETTWIINLLLLLFSVFNILLKKIELVDKKKSKECKNMEEVKKHSQKLTSKKNSLLCHLYFSSSVIFQFFFNAYLFEKIENLLKYLKN